MTLVDALSTELSEATADGKVALVTRGACTFVQKGENVAAAGYAGMVVFNGAAQGDALGPMGGATGLRIPGVLVGHTTGLAIAGVENEGGLEPGTPGHEVSVGAEVDGWSGLRIWDFFRPRGARVGEHL